MRKLALGLAALSLTCAFDSSGASGGVDASTGMSSGSTLDASSSNGEIPTTSAANPMTSSNPTSTATTSVDGSDTTSTSSNDEGGTIDVDPLQGSSSESTGAPLRSTWCDAARDDLAACYAFADLAGGVLVDDAAPGIDGTVENVGIDEGPLGEAAVFSSDSRISVPPSSATDLPDAVTIELFLRVDAIPAGGRAGVVDRDGQWSLFLYADGRLRCGASVFTYTPVPAVGDWMHIGCVVGVGWTRLFIDGVLASELEFNGAIVTGDGNPLSIGDNSPGFEEPLAGAISGVRIWSTVRAAEELCEGAGDLCA